MSKSDEIYQRLLELDVEERNLHEERDVLRERLLIEQQKEADELGLTRFGKPMDAQTVRNFMGHDDTGKQEIIKLWQSRSGYNLGDLVNG